MGILGKRHVATVSFYVYDDDSQKAFNEAQKIVDRINEDDLKGTVDEFHIQKAGTWGGEKLDVNDLKYKNTKEVNEF